MRKKLSEVKKGDSIYVLHDNVFPPELCHAVATRDVISHFELTKDWQYDCPDTGYVIFYMIDGRTEEINTTLYGGEFDACRGEEGHIATLFTDENDALTTFISKMKKQRNELFQEIEYRWKQMDICEDILKRYNYGK